MDDSSHKPSQSSDVSHFQLCALAVHYVVNIASVFSAVVEQCLQQLGLSGVFKFGA